mmetsp:Transcript_21981/g.47325  ORF Transcript_21981/g.47325 Transcript_21981/m.47325 type:complete len:180 (-) Transcript_21981:201-740(-)
MALRLEVSGEPLLPQTTAVARRASSLGRFVEQLLGLSGALLLGLFAGAYWAGFAAPRTYRALVSTGAAASVPITRSLRALPIVPISHKGVVASKRVMLKRGEVPHVAQFAQSVLEAGSQAERHTHAGLMEVYFVQLGLATFTLGWQTRALGPGEMITIPEDMEHFLNVSGEVTWCSRTS